MLDHRRHPILEDPVAAAAAAPWHHLRKDLVVAAADRDLQRAPCHPQVEEAVVRTDR